MRRLKRDTLFGADSGKGSLAKKTVKGGVVTMSSQGVLFLINTLSTMVLARLLLPDDFGLVSIVMVVVGFAERFKDAGLSMATVQRAQIAEEQISSLFWINLAISAGISVLLIAVAPLVGAFYERQELVGVLRLLSLTFVFSGLTIQHNALLKRHLQFTSISAVQIGALLIKQAVSIFLAYRGWDYMALASGAIVQSLAVTLGTFFFCPWLPGRPRRASEVGNMLRFGGHLTLFSVVNFLTNNIGQAILGKTADAGTVGNYAKAKGILTLPLSRIRFPVASVMTPVLSKLQDDPEKFRRYYYAVVFFLAFVTMPVTMVFMLYPRDIVLVYLGPKWSHAAEIFSVFCWYSLVYAVSTIRGMALVALGKSRRYSTFGLMHGLSNIAGIAIGSMFGAVGIAWGFVIVNYAIWVPTLYYCFKDTPLSVKGYFKACWLPLAVCLVGGGAVKLLDGLLASLGYWRILVGGGLFGAFYLSFWWVAMKRQWQPELNEALELMLSMIRKRKAKA